MFALIHRYTGLTVSASRDSKVHHFTPRSLPHKKVLQCVTAPNGLRDTVWVETKTYRSLHEKYLERVREKEDGYAHLDFEDLIRFAAWNHLSVSEDLPFLYFEHSEEVSKALKKWLREEYNRGIGPFAVDLREATTKELVFVKLTTFTRGKGRRTKEEYAKTRESKLHAVRKVSHYSRETMKEFAGLFYARDQSTSALSLMRSVLRAVGKTGDHCLPKGALALKIPSNKVCLLLVISSVSVFFTQEMRELVLRMRGQFSVEDPLSGKMRKVIKAIPSADPRGTVQMRCTAMKLGDERVPASHVQRVYFPRGSVFTDNHATLEGIYAMMCDTGMNSGRERVFGMYAAVSVLVFFHL